MDIQPKSREGCVRTFTVTFPAEELAGHEDEIVKKVRSEATIKGFRPGKAPADLIKVRFSKLIREEILEKLLPEAVDKIRKDHGIRPVVDPYVKDMEGERGESAVCEILFEVPPALPELSDLSTEITIVHREVTPEDVDRNIEALRQQAASVRPVEGAAEEGDYAEVHLLRKQQRVPKPATLHRVVRKDSGHALDSRLSGKKAGDVFTIDVSEEVGGDDKESLAAGEYEVRVHRVLRREMPESDEDFAKHYGMQSLEDLKRKVTADLNARAEVLSRQEKEARVVEELLRRYPFDVPPTLVERQLRENADEMSQDFARHGIDPESLQWDEMARSMKTDAALQVGRFFLLEEIARREGLEAGEEDLDGYFEQKAAASSRPDLSGAQVRAAYEKENRLGSLRTFIRHRKVLDLLVKNASVTMKAEEPPQQEDADGAHSDRSGTDQ